MKILHAFADNGVESEVLVRHGEVVRVGTDPGGVYGEVVKADATRMPLKSGSFDFGIFHPLCQRWARATPVDVRESYPDLLDETRQEAKRLCDNWVIENVKRAPLKDPVVLGGWHFGKKWANERAFETNFHVPQLPQYEGEAKYYTNRGYKHDWLDRKGYTEDSYTSHAIKKNSVSAFIVELLVQCAKRYGHD